MVDREAGVVYRQVSLTASEGSGKPTTIWWCLVFLRRCCMPGETPVSLDLLWLIFISHLSTSHRIKDAALRNTGTFWFAVENRQCEAGTKY